MIYNVFWLEKILLICEIKRHTLAKTADMLIKIIQTFSTLNSVDSALVKNPDFQTQYTFKLLINTTFLITAQ